jgi:hypothetical protein
MLLPSRSSLKANLLKSLLHFITLSLMTLTLAACAWLGSRKPLPEPSEIVVTGAPGGSTIYLDGTQAAPPTAADDRPQVLRVVAGDHQLEIHAGDKIVYREDTYVARGERRMVTVLSGLNR